jgi:toxin ParE1/3/4
MAKADVVWAESACADLFSLLEPLRTNAPKRALRVMNQMVGAVARLADLPGSGRKPPEIPDDEHIRELVIEHFRLFYSYHADQGCVKIIAVFSARQDIEPALRSRIEQE